jgi:predicted metal-dependent hydrolase
LMVTQIDLGGIVLNVVKKDIKNIHLSVYPPAGRVRVTAPLRMKLDTIRLFAISKLGWIRKQQKKLREQERDGHREYVDRESHYVWGKRYLLKIVEEEITPEVGIQRNHLVIRVRPGTNEEARQAIVSRWYRGQIKLAALELVAKWERSLGVSVDRVFVQKMKTKWGSCNADRRTVRLNTDLATKPAECLEYIVVHELVHLLERDHNERFTFLMDHFMPQWREIRNLLNAKPLAYEAWTC